MRIILRKLYVFLFSKYIKDISNLVEQDLLLRKTLETKKQGLMVMVSKQDSKEKEERMLIEINVLSAILNEPTITFDNIFSTLRVYPEKLKD